MFSEIENLDIMLGSNHPERKEVNSVTPYVDLKTLITMHWLIMM